jgi:hypothetical protein
MSSELEIESFFREYFVTFQNLDAAKVIPYLHMPVTFITSPNHLSVQTAAEAQQVIQMWMQDMRERGYTRSELQQLQIKVLDESLALVHARGPRSRADGSALPGMAALYTLRKLPEGWRIVGYTLYNAQFPLELV